MDVSGGVMDSVEADLLQMIHERPDDDRPRMVYADWLTQRGDERGELVTLQCARARLEEHDPRRDDLRRRETKLFREHEREWLDPLPARGRQLTWSRGFLAHPLVATGEQIAEHGDLLWRLSPTLYEPVRTLRQTTTRLLLEARVLGPARMAGRCIIRSYPTLRPNICVDEDVLLYEEALRVEQQISCGLRHPNLIRGLGLAYGWTGQRHLALEWLDGADLATLRETYRQPVPPALAAHVVRQICLGLEHLHQATDPSGGPRGLSHRSVQSGHVFLTRDGEVKLIDFSHGTAGDASHPILGAGHRRSAPNALLEMLPAGDRHVPVRADLLAAALLLCELIRGRENLATCRGLPFEVLVTRALSDLPSLQSAAQHALGGDAREVQLALKEAMREEGWQPGRRTVARFVRSCGEREARAR